MKGKSTIPVSLFIILLLAGFVGLYFFGLQAFLFGGSSCIENTLDGKIIGYSVIVNAQDSLICDQNGAVEGFHHDVLVVMNDEQFAQYQEFGVIGENTLATRTAGCHDSGFCDPPYGITVDAGVTILASQTASDWTCDPNDGPFPGILLEPGNVDPAIQGTTCTWEVQIEFAQAPTEFCDDGICQEGEDFNSCPQDCEAPPPPPPEEFCGDGTCQEDEDFDTCPADCEAPPPENGEFCGDNACQENEDFDSCPLDCEEPPPIEFCGDGICQEVEDPVSCGVDCPSVCGDGLCSGLETSATCQQDCPASCGDGVCNEAETPATCLFDCPSICGDNICTGTEFEFCFEDCPQFEPPPGPVFPTGLLLVGGVFLLILIAIIFGIIRLRK